METIDIQIKSNAPEITKETTSLRQQVKELRKEMESCAVGSDEYNAALVKLAQTTHDLREQQEAVKNSAGDLGTALNNIQQVGTGIAAGFSSVNAIMALTGSNNEALQKTFVKLQAGMALVQGLKGMEGMGKKMKALITSIKSMTTTTKAQTTANKALATSENTVTGATKGVSVAMKGLKAAIIATGIGALIFLVGELINGLGKLFDWLGNVMNETNEFAEASDNLNKEFEKQNKEFDREVTIMQASGETTQAVIKKKKELKQAQLAETLATIKSIEARNAQLEADKRWWKFWQNNGSQIKDNNEQIKKLNETVEALQDTIKDLDTEAEADIIKSSREAGKKAVDEAKKRAEDYKKTLKGIEDNAEKTFAAILKSYKETIQNLGRIEFAVSEDMHVWKTIMDYFNDPTAPKALKTKLAGIADGVASYAKDALTESFYKQLEAIDVEKVTEELAKRLGKDISQVTATELNAELDARKEKIAREYYNAISDIFEDLPSFDDYFSGQFDLVPQFTTILTPYVEAAKAIPEQFTETFTALQSAYKDGLIDYNEFFATLVGIQNTYNEKLEDYRATALEKLKNDYEQKRITTEQYENALVEIEYAYAIKPLSFQKEVGEKFMDNLKMQLGQISAEYEKESALLERQVINWEGQLATWGGLFSTTLTQRYQVQQEILDKTYNQWMDQYAQQKAALTEQMNNDMLTVEQRAELWNQMNALDEERLLREAEYKEQSKANYADWVHNIHETINSGIQEFATLTSALNSVSEAQLKEYKRQYEAGEISKEKYEALEKEALENQAALQIATTIMQTSAGIATVWAQAAKLGPIAGPIIAGIQTAAYLANMAAQIISIKTALAQGLAGNTSGSGTSASEAPDTSFTLTSPDAYQTTLSDETQSDLQANAQQNQRVYVVSSDISDAQNNEKTTVTTATF